MANQRDEMGKDGAQDSPAGRPGGKEEGISKNNSPLATVGNGGVGVTGAATAPQDRAQAVVLMRLPRCAGRFADDCTGGKACSKAFAVEL